MQEPPAVTSGERRRDSVPGIGPAHAGVIDARHAGNTRRGRHVALDPARRLYDTFVN